MKINDIFLSIQGEGLSQGLLTVFVRTASCNLKCAWCDTMYQNVLWDIPPQEVYDKVKEFGIYRVCLTGGEPLKDPETKDLLKLFDIKDWDISIETNGSIDITPYLMYEIVMDIKLPSSKMDKYMRFSNLQLLKSKDQVKFVIKDRKDYCVAKEMIKCKTKAQVIFSPVFDKRLKVAREIVQWVIEDKLPVRYQVQLHRQLLVK